ncbi:MAG: hypothetical protein QOK38_3771 [Acidobacteriaceae bacterium]|jgi:hypothetical protein|nr:hypothetical protein [Acidobacteriaceae bacterium]
MVRETYLLTKTMPNSWHTLGLRLLGFSALLSSAPHLWAQTPAVSPYIASTRAQALQAAGVQVSGDVHLGNGDMQLGNGSTITAGGETVPIALTRGGELKLCATTSIHLSRDRSIQAPDASGLMLGLDRGAVEAHYETSKYSDVMMTPDLRILISGPGEADFSIRVSSQGDTCIDNRGPNAPYITVSSQLEGGLYRVQPGQHVSFQHGSLREVVDTEHEPCGCPAPISVAEAGTPSPVGAAPGHPVGGPSSTPADTAFPLAVSEGLTKPPLPPTTPVAEPGEVHAQVAVPFRYSGNLPTVGDTTGTEEPADAEAAAIPPPSPAAPAPAPSNMPAPPLPAPPLGSSPVPAAVPLQATIAQAPTHTPGPKQPVRRFFRRVGRFFSRVFGAEQ